MNTSTYYVLSYSLGPLYITPESLGDPDVSKAQRYGTLSAALTDAKANGWESLSEFHVVLVTETATAATQQVTAKRVIDAAEPCVLYHVPTRTYGKVYPDGTLRGGDLSEATVFTDLADAMIANAQASAVIALQRKTMPSLDVTHVHQVEMVDSTFSYTTTVLP